MQNAKRSLCLVPALFYFKSDIKEENKMKESKYKSFDELPMVLNAKIVSEVLGLSISSTYELMRGNDFPAKRIGKRIIVSKEDFRAWLET